MTTRKEKLNKVDVVLGSWKWEHNGEEIFLLGSKDDLWVAYFRKAEEDEVAEYGGESDWMVDEFYINAFFYEEDIQHILYNPTEFVRYFGPSANYPPTATFTEERYWVARGLYS